MIKLIKKSYEGLVTSEEAALSNATRILEKKKNGSSLLLSYWNGIDLFIKENDTVRCSTQEEFKKVMANEWDKIKA